DEMPGDIVGAEREEALVVAGGDACIGLLQDGPGVSGHSYLEWSMDRGGCRAAPSLETQGGDRSPADHYGSGRKRRTTTYADGREPRANDPDACHRCSAGRHASTRRVDAHAVTRVDRKCPACPFRRSRRTRRRRVDIRAFCNDSARSLPCPLRPTVEIECT